MGSGRFGAVGVGGLGETVQSPTGVPAGGASGQAEEFASAGSRAFVEEADGAAGGASLGLLDLPRRLNEDEEKCSVGRSDQALVAAP